MISPPNKSGKLILDLLSERDMTQSQLSASTNVSTGYTNHVLTGRRLPSAGWLDVVSSVMNLPKEKKLDLHRAAGEDLARRHGYKTDEDS